MIEKYNTFTLRIEINCIFFDINFGGITFLGIAQLYFCDTTAKNNMTEKD